jgi:hypothetical protein
MIINCTNAIGSPFLTWGWNFDLLADPCPHLSQGWQQAQIHFITIIKVIARP